MSESKTNYQVADVKQAWADMCRRLLIVFPQWVSKALDGEGQNHKAPAIIKAIPVVIIMLSVASISVINSRAVAHHAGWNSPLVSTGVAVLVPLATLAAALIKHRGWSSLFWVVAFFVAFVSGSIQYNVYVDADAVGVEVLEAYAFGYGIPFAEVLFAIMEAVSINQWMTQKKQEEAEERKEYAFKARQQTEKENAEKEHIARLQREEEDREFERRKREAELRAYEIKLKQDAEIERENALASIRIREQKAEKNSGLPGANNRATGRANNRANAPSGKYTKQVKMVEMYRANPSLPLAEAGNELGVSKSTARNYRDELVRLSVLDLDGEGKNQLVKVNGQSEEFLNGELG